MANFKINGVTFASETGGKISLSNANVFPPGMIVGSAVTFFNEITSYTMLSGASTSGGTTNDGNGDTNYNLLTGLDIDDLIVTYTPKNIANKLFVSGVVNLSTSGDANGKVYATVRVKRQINGTGYSMLESVMNTDTGAMTGDRTNKGLAGYSNNFGSNNSGHPSFNLHFGFIDSSHATTTGHVVNYKLNHTLKGNDSSNKTLYLNRNYYQPNDYGATSSVSYLRVEEIQHD